VVNLNFLKKLLSGRSGKRNEFFANAVKVYALKGEEDARCAALAAAKASSRRQRKSMSALLEKMAANVVQSYPDKVLRKSLADRLLSLKKEIEIKNWDPVDVRKEEERLAKINEEYRFCLNQADPSIFKRKYPGLF
jgi:hypothetical protein